MNYVNAKEYMEQALNLRYEMLQNLTNSSELNLDQQFKEHTMRFFAEGNQTTLLAIDKHEAIACATICYVTFMPTLSHQTGKRAHIMNVYTRSAYRRKGIAKRLLELLLAEAKEKGVTNITLDSTDIGKPLYKSLGFQGSDEYMEINNIL